MNTQRRIDVMHFASQLIRGGAEEHMLTLLTHLDRARFRPMLAAPPVSSNRSGPTCLTISMRFRSLRELLAIGTPHGVSHACSLGAG
jgi:hypothetical protein